MKMPSDYEQGYAKARALDPDVTANYIAHTLIGDPEADALVEQLSALEPEEAPSPHRDRHGKSGQQRVARGVAGAA